jgi:hypothetical protein
MAGVSGYSRSEIKALRNAKKKAQRARGKAAHAEFTEYEKYGPYTAMALFDHCSTQFNIGEDYASINVAEHLDEYWPLYHVDELRNLRTMLDKMWPYADWSPKHVKRIMTRVLDRDTVLNGQCMNFRFLVDKDHQDLLLEWILEDYINFPDCVDVFTSKAAFEPALLVSLCGSLSQSYPTGASAIQDEDEDETLTTEEED